MAIKNSGVVVLNGDAATLPTKTVIVLGLGRGGTSMVSGVLSKLGVYMGDGLDSRYQDQAILNCLNRNDKKQARATIQDRNRQYPIWGLKKLRLWRWDNEFREPVYVVVFRDLLATANRRQQLFNVSLLNELFKLLGLSFQLLVFLKTCKRPLFLASYEKALIYPEDFVQTLAAFVGINNPAAITDAVEFIRPSPSEYTNSPVNFRHAQATKTLVGYIDEIDADRVYGWALDTTQTKSVRLELLVNGRLIQTASAELLRPDVAAADTRFHDACGFVFTLADSERLQNNDQIDIRFAGTNHSLLNTPYIF